METWRCELSFSWRACLVKTFCWIVVTVSLRWNVSEALLRRSCFRRFPEGFAYTLWEMLWFWRLSVYLYIFFYMLLYTHPGLGHLYIYTVYIYMCVFVQDIHTLFLGRMQQHHTQNKKNIDLNTGCIEWIGKFCHFLYWHRIPGDSPSVRCSTDWCSSVVKSKWLPMLDKRTIFPQFQFPINFLFPSIVIMLYSTVMYNDISISHCITLSPSNKLFLSTRADAFFAALRTRSLILWLVVGATMLSWAV